jgi:putative peptidoglycan lipid II flippase
MNTLGFFSLSLFAQSLIPLLVRAFYARHNSRTPFFIGLAVVIINVFLSLWLSREIGVAGLALAFSITNIANFIILWFVLRSKLGELDELRILISTVKFSAAALSAGVAIQAMKLIIWPFIDMTKTWGVLTQGAVAGLAGIIIYVVICFVVQSEELFDFWKLLRRRLPWVKVEASDQGEARGI